MYEAKLKILLTKVFFFRGLEEIKFSSKLVFFFFFCLFLPVFVYYIFLFSIINDEFGCEVVQAKVPIRNGTT